jgi:hypothetical protein
MLIAAFAAAVFLLPDSASARGWYFNKPGVSRDAYMADVAECIELAGGARPRTIYAPYSPNIIAAGANAFFAGMMRSAERRRMRNMVERTCMADKGYGRFEVDNAVLNEIHDLPTEAARLDRLFGLASAAAPIGERMAE